MTLSHTTLGFEIEYLRSTNVDDVLRNLRTAGAAEGMPSLVNVVDERTTYNTTFSRSAWTQGYDMSCGWEIKSHPLKETNEVKEVMRGIRLAGGSVDHTCGLHVHVGVAHLSFEQLRTLCKIFARHERSLEELLPASRRSESYAQSNHTRYVDNTNTSSGFADHVAALDRCSSLRELRRVANSRGKCSKFNMTPIDTKTTVEFRGHQGTLNFRKIDSWTSLLVAMVRLAEAPFTMRAASATFEETMNELTVKATKTPKQPREGTIARRVWDLMDERFELYQANELRGAEFQPSDASPSGTRLKFQDARALALVELNLTQAQVHGPIVKWSKSRGLTRRPSDTVQGLRTYLETRRETLHTRALARPAHARASIALRDRS